MYWPRSVGWLAGANQTGEAMKLLDSIFDAIDSDEAIFACILSVALLVGIIIGVSIKWAVVGG